MRFLNLWFRAGNDTEKNLPRNSFVREDKIEEIHCSNQYFMFFFERAKFDAIYVILQSKH